MDGTTSEIRGWGANFAPRNWAYCSGQLISISSNSALFSLLGTIYGGDGRVSFGIPDLRGRVPIGSGTGPGLSPKVLGSPGGMEYVTLSLSEMPVHSHTATTTVTAGSNSVTGLGTIPVGIGAGNSNSPTNNWLAPSVSVTSTKGTVTVSPYTNNGPAVQDSMGSPVEVIGEVDTSKLGVSTAVGNQGGGQSHYNMQPYMTIHWIMCMTGIYPSRN